MLHVVVAVLTVAPALTARAVSLQEPGRRPLQEGQEARAPKTGVLQRNSGASPGYTLVAPLRSTTTYLVDLDGEVVHRWESDTPPGQSVRLLEDGRLLRTERVDDNPTFQGGGEGGRVRLIEPDGSVAWSFEYSDEEHLQHHDALMLPSGNVLMVAWERRSSEEALAAGRDPELLGEGEMWVDHLVEVEPTGPETGEVVWEWHVWDHLVQDRERTKPGYDIVSENPGRIDLNADGEKVQPTDEELEDELRKLRELGYLGGGDEEESRDGGERRPPRRADWNHVNSIDYDPVGDLIVLSVREFSEVWVIDHSTTTEEAAGSKGGRHGRGGDLLFRWGNPRMHGAGDEQDQQLFFQHDAQWIRSGSPGAGNLLVFNNGSREDGRGWSSADEIALPLDAEGRLRVPADGSIAPAEVVWTHVPTEGGRRVFSSRISGVERLANGNTLVCCGEQGKVTEVTPEGELVWDWRNPFGDDSVGPGSVPGGPRGPRGRPTRGDGRPGRPPPEGRAGFPPRGERGPGGRRGGPGGMSRGGLFRVRRYAPDHPGLERVLEEASATPADETGEDR